MAELRLTWLFRLWRKNGYRILCCLSHDCDCSVTDKIFYYILNSSTLFWLAESVQRIFEISAPNIITADYTIIMSRTLEVTGNHVMYDRGAWFLRLIMSTSRDSCLLPSVKKQKQFLCSMYNKTIKIGFCDIQNNQGLVDLDYSGYHKNLIQ